jgi:hypothetical protein
MPYVKTSSCDLAILLVDMRGESREVSNHVKSTRTPRSVRRISCPLR